MLTEYQARMDQELPLTWVAFLLHLPKEIKTYCDIFFEQTTKTKPNIGQIEVLKANTNSYDVDSALYKLIQRDNQNPEDTHAILDVITNHIVLSEIVEKLTHLPICERKNLAHRITPSRLRQRAFNSIHANP